MLIGSTLGVVLFGVSLELKEFGIPVILSGALSSLLLLGLAKLYDKYIKLFQDHSDPWI